MCFVLCVCVCCVCVCECVCVRMRVCAHVWSDGRVRMREHALLCI